MNYGPDLEDRPTAELVSAQRTLLGEVDSLFLDGDTPEDHARAEAIAAAIVAMAKVLGLRHRYGVGLDVVQVLSGMGDGDALAEEVLRGATELVAARLARAA